MTDQQVFIRTVLDLKLVLTRFASRGYHINFDDTGRTIVALYPEDYDVTVRRALACMDEKVRQNVRFKKISGRSRFANFFIQTFLRGFA